MSERTMEILYSPWRSRYVQEADRETKAESIVCPLCAYAQAPEHDDDKNFILVRLHYTYVLLNLYPYNGGHVMVVPYKHVSNLTDLTPEERAEMTEATTHMIDVIKEVLKPNGFNIGMNIGGKAAGGSIPEHIHMHVLPRWSGDTGFLPVLADTKPISQNLVDTYRKLKKYLRSDYLKH